MGFSSITKSLVKDNAASDNAAERKAASGFKSIFVSSPTHIWSSKVSWRVALTAFLTIMLVQTFVLNVGGVAQFRANELKSLELQARSAIASVVDPESRGTRTSPFNESQIERMFRTTHIRGLTVYSYKYDFIKSYGEPVHLIAKFGQLDETYMSENGNVYELIFKSSDIQSTFIVVVQMDSSRVEEKVHDYVMDSIKIMGILSLLVTSVLMIALGKWLLEPILFMRANLVAAFKNPELPEIEDSPYSSSDEIGAAIALTQKLIKQNAESLKHIKSTAEDKIHKLAYYDSLTGLPNRTLFVQTLSEKGNVRRGEDVPRFAIVTLDLDHFKDINDSMGHNVGDAILRSVGKKLRASLPESAFVSRTGEDEFAIMMPLVDDALNARDVAERVAGVIKSQPFKVFNEEFQVRSSIGVSTYPDDGAEPDMVLKNADIALNRAKEEGRDTIKEYSEDFDRAVQERFQILRDLRDALEHNQLDLHYQPQLCLKTGQVIGAEALLRWWKPDNSKEGGSFVSPGVFIPVAEQSGLIVPIGQYVLRRACETSVRLKKDHGIDMRIAVNVSGNQFTHGDICSDVIKCVHDTGVDPKMLELEVTESVFMDDINHTVSILNDLHKIGVELAIDDFGTGYSSLSYLSQFPIDRLKIDQSFVRQALNDKENASIAKTIINLGHSLNLKVIAEGVETKEHENFLINQGCDEVQGFRYSRPVPEKKLVEFIESYNGDLNSFKG